MNRHIILFALFFMCACAALPVDTLRVSEQEYVLTYHKRALDNVTRMRQEIMLKAQEVCRGAFQRIEEFPDPEGIAAPPSMELNWRIRCFQ